MANQMAELPWAIDTPSASLLFSTMVFVEHFEFVGYALDTDSVIVQNKNGQVVWQNNGAADLRNVISAKIGDVNGLKVTTLTSGKLLVYFR